MPDVDIHAQYCKTHSYTTTIMLFDNVCATQCMFLPDVIIITYKLFICFCVYYGQAQEAKLFVVKNEQSDSSFVYICIYIYVHFVLHKSFCSLGNNVWNKCYLVNMHLDHESEKYFY